MQESKKVFKINALETENYDMLRLYSKDWRKDLESAAFVEEEFLHKGSRKEMRSSFLLRPWASLKMDWNSMEAWWLQGDLKV